MPGAGIPDIRPLIANDQRYVRFYLCVAPILVVIGVVLGISVLALFKSLGEYRDMEKMAGGAVGAIVSFFSAYPMKEVFARLDRLRILRLIEPHLATTSKSSAKYVQLVWKIYEKTVTGS